MYPVGKHLIQANSFTLQKIKKFERGSCGDIEKISKKVSGSRKRRKFRSGNKGFVLRKLDIIPKMRIWNSENWKMGSLWASLACIMFQNITNIEGWTLWRYSKIFEKNFSVPKII